MIQNNKPQKRLPLTNDYIFKKVFAKEGNEELLKDLLESILDIKIEKVEVKNPELPKDIYDRKAGILDIKVQIDEDKICDVEMQVTNEKNIDHRSIYYLGMLVSEQLEKGEDYKTIKKSISINLLNFNYYNRNSYHQVAHMKFEETKKEEYVDLGYTKEEEIATKDVEMHFIEIPKFIKKNPGAKTKLEQWLWLLVGEGGKIKMAEKENEKIKEASIIVEKMSMDEKEWEAYRSRRLAELNYNSGIETARREGIAEGTEKGKKEKSIQIAKKLLKMGIKIEDIKEATELTEEEIMKLQVN